MKLTSNDPDPEDRTLDLKGPVPGPRGALTFTITHIAGWLVPLPPR